MKKHFRVSTALLAAVLLAGCGSISSKDGGYYATESPSAEGAYDTAAGAANSSIVPEELPDSTDETAQKIIYNADINMESTDFDAARDTLLAVQQAPFPVLEEKAGERMRAEILRAREAGDSVGGVVECIVTGLPAGVGSPMFQGLESHLAAALFAIPAVKGVEFGSGFGAAGMRGSEHNDPFVLEHGAIRTASNHAGGILGGISSGMPVVFRAAFKPTPSIAQKQHTVRLSAGTEEELQITGRHDPCIVPRAVPVVEAAAALVLLDALLDRNTDQIAWSAPQGARP